MDSPKRHMHGTMTNPPCEDSPHTKGNALQAAAARSCARMGGGGIRWILRRGTCMGPIPTVRRVLTFLSLSLSPSCVCLECAWSALAWIGSCVGFHI